MVTGVTRVLPVAAMMALGLASLGGCAQVLAQESASPETSARPAQSTPAPEPSLTDSELADLGLIDSSGVTPAVQALMDDLDVYINDGDIGVVADIDGEPSGYASFVIRTWESAVDLYWKGPLPAQVTTIIAAHPDVDTTVHQVEWTLAELIVGRDVAVELLTSGDFAGLDLQTVGPHPDGSRLIIQLGEVTPAEVRRVESAVLAATGIAVLIETGVHFKPAVTR